MRKGMIEAGRRLRAAAGRLWSWARPRLPDFQDLNLYGGITAIAYGVSSLTEAAWGWVVAGLALFYLGIRPSQVALRHLELQSRQDREAA